MTSPKTRSYESAIDLAEGVAPLPERKLTDALAARLEAMIDQGQLAVGARLPPERDLASMFNVSRASMREALHQLVLKGLIDRRPGRGTVVLDRATEHGRTLNRSVLPASDITQALDFRRVIEPAIAAHAAVRATRADLIRLEEVIRFTDQERTLAGFVRLDRTFHDLIARACHNPLLVTLSALTADWMAKTRSQALQTAARRQASRKAHRAIYRAIASGDPSAAEAAMAKHIDEVTALITGQTK